MKKELIKIRVIHVSHNKPYVEIIQYEDDVLDSGKTYKGSQRHEISDIVSFGEPWLDYWNMEDYEDTVYYGAYCVMPKGTTYEEASAKIIEMFELLKDEAKKMPNRYDPAEVENDKIEFDEEFIKACLE